jgi:hypothetical protein
MNKKEKMYQQIEQHGQRLNNLFNTELDNVALCKKLFRLENKAHRLATKYCNGEIDFPTWSIEKQSIHYKVGKILDNSWHYIFVNEDARGYAIKFTYSFTNDNTKNMYRDLGGYGIVAPDFKETTT